jgi:hypothetical protein
MSDIIMTRGCSKCTKEFTMGTDTHNYKYIPGSKLWPPGKPMFGGTCPHCGTYNTWLMHAKEIACYPPTHTYFEPGPECKEIVVTEVPYHANI